MSHRGRTAEGGGETKRNARRAFLYEGKMVEEWVPEAVERFDPLRVILFGSLACGEMVYDSDIDLLVVFEEVEWENKRELTVEIRRALLDKPVPMDIIVTNLDEMSPEAKSSERCSTRPCAREGFCMTDPDLLEEATCRAFPRGSTILRMDNSSRIRSLRVDRIQ